jgi:hypothetical protein
MTTTREKEKFLFREKIEIKQDFLFYLKLR